MKRIPKLLVIWSKLTLTSFEVLYYKARLLFQRMEYYIQETFDTHKIEKQSKTTDSNEEHEMELFEQYGQKKSAHESELHSSSKYVPYEGPVCETP